MKTYDIPGTARRQSGPGMIKGDDMERALIALLHVLAWTLIALSVLGTFYGVRGVNAPLHDPLRVIADIAAMPSMLVAALIVQGLLSVVQWGSRQRAMKPDKRHWWALYFVALAFSVYWNWQAYGDPLIVLGMPWLLAGGLVLGGDVLPEWAIVKD
jgi:hypothetical protein